MSGKAIPEGFQIGRNGELERKPTRPRTIGEARDMIRAIFVRQGLDGIGWNDDLQRKYFEQHGVSADSVDSLSPDNARKILEGMERSRMVNFRD
jgi:hypothetical protein